MPRRPPWIAAEECRRTAPSCRGLADHVDLAPRGGRALKAEPLVQRDCGVHVEHIEFGTELPTVSFAEQVGQYCGANATSLPVRGELDSVDVQTVWLPRHFQCTD